MTAFYGVYDPAQRLLTYSSAGHNPPRIKSCAEGWVQSLEEVGGPPLGLFDDLPYDQTTLVLKPGDILAFYTDGITEAMDSRNVQFGVQRLDQILSRCGLDAADIVREVIESVDAVHRRAPSRGRPDVAGGQGVVRSGRGASLVGGRAPSGRFPDSALGKGC